MTPGVAGVSGVGGKSNVDAPIALFWAPQTAASKVWPASSQSRWRPTTILANLIVSCFSDPIAVVFSLRHRARNTALQSKAHYRSRESSSMGLSTYRLGFAGARTLYFAGGPAAGLPRADHKKTPTTTSQTCAIF